MGGKFTIAGTVDRRAHHPDARQATILFLGVPPAQSPVFFALVVIVVVLVQSPRLHIARAHAARSALRRSSHAADGTPIADQNEAEVAS